MTAPEVSSAGHGLGEAEKKIGRLCPSPNPAEGTSGAVLRGLQLHRRCLRQMTAPEVTSAGYGLGEAEKRSDGFAHRPILPKAPPVRSSAVYNCTGGAFGR